MAVSSNITLHILKSQDLNSFLNKVFSISYSNELIRTLSSKNILIRSKLTDQSIIHQQVPAYIL